jgi:hypothetical protein
MFACLLALMYINIHESGRAERLAHELQHINLGESSTPEALSLVRRYGGAKIDTSVVTNGIPNPGVGPCSQSDESYSIKIGLLYTVNRILSHLHPFHKMVLQPWTAGATIYFRNHAVLCLAYSAFVFGSDGHEIEARTQLSAREQTRDGKASGYDVSAGILRGDIHIVEAQVAPEATTEERRHAFNFEFSCLATLDGCQRPCQILPSAWKDAVIRSRGSGWRLPEEDINDPHCSK